MRLITIVALFFVLCVGAPTAIGAGSHAAVIAEGKRLFESGRFDQAEVLFEKALSKQPDNKAARYYLDLTRDAMRRHKLDPRQHTPRHPPLMPPRNVPDIRT